MARPLRIQFPGAFYHITCRGIERRKIFIDDQDRCRFSLFYPNPAKGILRIRFNSRNNRRITIKLYDAAKDL